MDKVVNDKEESSKDVDEAGTEEKNDKEKTDKTYSSHEEDKKSNKKAESAEKSPERHDGNEENEVDLVLSTFNDWISGNNLQ